MTNEEIRKLLGGYATNTLTDAERKVLFEAALDDQELFNAMQEEQTLKDFLSDPVSREQVRQALESPARAKQASAWWSQWWAWSAASAVVAAILIVAAIGVNPFQPKHKEVASATLTTPAKMQPATSEMKPAEQPQPLARNRAALQKVESPAAKPSRPSSPSGARNERKDEVAAAPPAPPPSTAPLQAEVRENAPNRPVPSSGASSAVNAGHSQDQISQVNSANTQNTIANQAPPRQEQFQPAPAANALRDSRGRVDPSARMAADVNAATRGFVGGPLRYSLIKRDSNGDFVPVQTNPDLKKGDAVQLRVVPALSGFVSLSQLDQSGTWRRVFPSSDSGIPVIANASYNLPDSPIEVTDKDEKFRVTLSLATPETVRKAAAEKDSTSRKKAIVGSFQKQAPETSPLFVDLTIGPKK